VGGAMDLVAGVKKVIVMMEHVTRKGLAKLIPQCTLPLTGRRCVDMLITDLAVLEMDRDRNRFRLVELAPGVTVEDVKGKTTAEIVLSGELAAVS
ncbi:MAG: CoA-transferase, partial [Phycisphaerales bacterium]